MFVVLPYEEPTCLYSSTNRLFMPGGVCYGSFPSSNKARLPGPIPSLQPVFAGISARFDSLFRARPNRLRLLLRFSQPWAFLRPHRTADTRPLPMLWPSFRASQEQGQCDHFPHVRCSTSATLSFAPHPLEKVSWPPSNRAAFLLGPSPPPLCLYSRMRNIPIH